ncbi:hypothetical protein QMK38_00970 [Lysinibacillus fusiformis]|nr:hypothetical protein [Lysinibacillus fusiformis]
MTNKKSYFTIDDMQQIMEVNGKDAMKIFIPNQFFYDLLQCEDFKPKISRTKTKDGDLNTHVKEANVNHIAFAFSYLFIISYMYRYANFTFYKNDKEYFIDDKIIYKMCGISPTSRGNDGVSYITKKGGVLERLGYIKKDKDFPIDYIYYEDLNGKKDFNDVDFVMYSEIKDDLPSSFKRKNKQINYPVRAFYYDNESEQEGYCDGYFYNIQNTTEISLSLFIYCMSKGDIGKLGFYLYCFLKSKCDYFESTSGNKKYTRALNDLVNDTGIGKTKLSELLKVLEEHNMISNSHKPFVMDLPEGKKVPPNDYVTNNYEDFFKSFKGEVEIRKVMDYETYNEKIGIYVNTNEDNNNIEIELPSGM